MARMKMFRVKTLLLLLGLMTGVPNAAAIFVKQLGCGTTPNCYSAISSGINNALPGDTVWVGPGSYNETVAINKDLTLIGSGPQKTSISGTPNGITINTSIVATIKGFTITSSNYGIYLKPGTRTIVKNNCIVGNGAHGIYVDDIDGSSSLNTTICNNSIVSNVGGGIVGNNNFRSVPNAAIFCNIIFNNGSWGIYFPYKGTLNIAYNDVVGNATANYQNCAAGTGDISINPLFIDYTTGNFILQNISPCINTGRAGSVDADPDGTRNDMGAYGGPDAAYFWPYPAGTPIITNLTVNPTSASQGSTITITATGEIQ